MFLYFLISCVFASVLKWIFEQHVVCCVLRESYKSETQCLNLEVEGVCTYMFVTKRRFKNLISKIFT